MMNEVYDQLARTNILPKDMAARIFSGDPPPLSEIVMHLVYTGVDADALTYADPTSTWNEKRIARQALTIAFLQAILIEHLTNSETGGH